MPNTSLAQSIIAGLAIKLNCDQTPVTRPPNCTSPSQQRHIPPRRRGVHSHRLLAAKAQQVVWAAGFGAGAAQAFTVKGLQLVST